jgi:hypothetical protein
MVFIVKMDTKQLACEHVDWIYQAVCMEHQRNLDNHVMSLRFP